ncbi:MAG: glycoside hydrolase family 9 protein [Porcipelethomonas sp.]
MKTKKIIAAAAALVLSSSMLTFPSYNLSFADNSNLISNSTFDSGTANWGMYKESGGAAVLTTDNGRLALNVSSVGKLTYSVQMYYDIIPLYKNGVYHLSYEISSTADRKVEGMIQQNGGTYQAYTWKGIDVTSSPQTIDYTFTMEADTDIMSKLVFNCGNEGEELGEHTIYLDNVVLELVDDSKVDYSEIRAYEPPVVVNQIGYRPDSSKTAVIRNVTETGEAKTCRVINADTQEVVYSDTVSDGVQNSSADELDYIFDFSCVTQPGSYYIECSAAEDVSYTFRISDDIYENLLDDTVRMLYLQRCGTEISDSTFGHAACHCSKAKIYGTNEYIDVSGGWHDAGDYGRYVVPAAKTIADLLNAYAANPGAFSDSIGIPESGNGIPDILDEVRYDLEWMFKMQTDSGGVYHKVTCESFPGYIMPENETDELIVTPVSTTATGDFCGAMAMAYEYFKDTDEEFASKCLAAAEKAWEFLEANPDFIFKNPEDIVTGEYGDLTDTDERYWAAAQLYRSTGDSGYLSVLQGMSAKTGMDWGNVGDYGNIAIITMDGIDTSSSVYSNAKRAVINQANTFANNSQNSPYGVSLTKFNWGSNMTAANAGDILGLAYKLTGETKYLTAAADNLNYLLGKNPNGVCYVTGYGTVSPQNPHHRPSMAKNTAMKGMLVGGVNSAKEDSAAKAYLAGVPSAKCYVDHSESYSTNEVTTYWNSPLIYLLALTQNEDPDITGDVNEDGILSTFDVELMKKYLLNISDLTQSQWNNADINSDGTVNVMDLCILKRKCLEDHN